MYTYIHREIERECAYANRYPIPYIHYGNIAMRDYPIPSHPTASHPMPLSLPASCAFCDTFAEE